MRLVRGFVTMVSRRGALVGSLGLLVLLVAGAGGRARAEGEGAAGARAPVQDPTALDAHTRLGAPLTHKNLTLLPILERTAGKDDREYLSLDEAFDKKLVRVRELDDESVNQLSLENRSDRPLFVMSGEVILGGKQDRIIGKDRLIPPHKALAVDVFCVEHGRWTEEGGDNRSFRSAKVLAHTSLRLKASYDTQSDVWQEVASKNTQRKTENGTDTYRAVTADKQVAKDIRGYESFFSAALAKLPEGKRVVGFVVVMNGKLVGVESFGSPKLFAKLQGKLLRSYYVEAVDLPVVDDAALAYVPGAPDVKAFLARPAATPEQVIVQDKKGATRQKKGDGVAETSVVDEESPPAASPVFKSSYAH